MLEVLNPNKYNFLICNSVAACTREMVILAGIYGIKRIEFKNYPQIDTPSVTFNCDEIAEYADVKALVFDSDDAPVIIEGEHDWKAYLDDDYGDYFDVAHSVGRIYHAFIEVIQYHNPDITSGD